MKVKTRKSVFACLAVLLIMFSTCGIFGFAQAQGYSSGFEGPKARFYGVKLGSGALYSQSSQHSGSSLAQFDTVLRFDYDAATSGKPNLFGEQTSVFIPRESLGSIPAWLPSSWLNTMSYIQNPQASYNWTIGDRTYYMEQWLLRYYISLSAEWDGSTDLFGGHGEAPPQSQYAGGENNFPSMELWVEFDVEPTWYIQGQGTAYFALGKVQLADSVQYRACDVNGNDAGTARTTVSVSPESQGAINYLYYEPWGTGGSQNKEASYFMGKQLNPALFTDKLYMRLALNKFGVYGGAASAPLPIGFWTKGDTVKVAYDITVFVIGEWNVQDIQDNPDDFGRFTRTGAADDWLTWLLSSETLAWLIPVAIFVAVLLFAPWIIVLLVSLLRRR